MENQEFSSGFLRILAIIAEWLFFVPYILINALPTVLVVGFFIGT